MGNIPTDEELNRLAAASYMLQSLEQEVAALEKNLADTKERLRVQSEEVIPSIMQELFMSELKMANGTKIVIKRSYFGSISKERAHDACQWMREAGYGALVKNEVSLSFGKGEDDQVDGAVKVLIEAGYVPAHRETIHPQTLKAWVREMFEAGKAFPYDLFSAGSKPVAVIQIDKK